MISGGMKTRALPWICALVLCACSGPKPDRLFVLDRVAKQVAWKNSPSVFIAHAGGSVDLHTYTNSMEAIRNSIEEGLKFIEIDLIETSDGHLVGAHDWPHFKEITDYTGTHDDVPLSLEQFRESKILGRYTPVTLREISALFDRHDDLILVTDKSNDFDLILEQYDHHERLVIEVFGTRNFKIAMQKGIRYPALSTDFSDDHRAFIEAGNVQIIAFNTTFLNNPDTLEYAREYYARGISSMVFSTSDENFIEEHVGRAATLFYTDFWNLREGRCVHPEPTACVSQF